MLTSDWQNGYREVGPSAAAQKNSGQFCNEENGLNSAKDVRITQLFNKIIARSETNDLHLTLIPHTRDTSRLLHMFTSLSLLMFPINYSFNDPMESSENVSSMVSSTARCGHLRHFPF